jgi:RimJ/RimL family protein N-acetyltransferase
MERVPKSCRRVIGFIALGYLRTQMLSERLTYQPLTLASIDDFHQLVEDAHVRCYLMDGQLFPREWSEQRVRDSIGLFDRRGVGLWLARQRDSDELVGFCGFLEIRSVHPDPQLVYAMFERFTGMGYATEMARTAIAEARRQRGFSTIVAAVDEVNVASVHVLQKIGFRQVTVQTGSFGNVLVMQLHPSDSTVSR